MGEGGRGGLTLCLTLCHMYTKIATPLTDFYMKHCITKVEKVKLYLHLTHRPYPTMCGCGQEHSLQYSDLMWIPL